MKKIFFLYHGLGTLKLLPFKVMIYYVEKLNEDNAHNWSRYHGLEHLVSSYFQYHYTSIKKQEKQLSDYNHCKIIYKHYCELKTSQNKGDQVHYFQKDFFELYRRNFFTGEIFF